MRTAHADSCAVTVDRYAVLTVLVLEVVPRSLGIDAQEVAEIQRPIHVQTAAPTHLTGRPHTIVVDADIAHGAWPVRGRDIERGIADVGARLDHGTDDHPRQVADQ